MSTLSADKLHASLRREASWGLRAFKQFADDRCTAMAASIAFYSAFSLAPMLVMVIAVAGWFFGDEAARGQIFSHVHGLLGNEAATGVQTIVQNAHRSGSAGGIAAIISFALLAIGASATFSSLNTALSIIWPHTGSRPSTVVALVKVRLISFGLVLGVAFLLIVSLVLDTAITFVGQWLWGNTPYIVIGNLLQLAVGLLVLAFAFAALLKFLPDAPVVWRDALTGGAVAAVLFSCGKKLFALYLAHAGMANSFGAAGSLAVLLMWLYFSAAVLLLGAEFASARGHLHDPRGAWGLQSEETRPGSRAMLASALAASTVSAAAPAQAAEKAGRASGDGAASGEDALRNAALPSVAVQALELGRQIGRAERQAARATAATLLEAERHAAAADRYVHRHPWRAVMLAAGAALFLTSIAGRGNGGESSHSADPKR
ncbi:YihY family inner membrane protein [Trinickia terrae]|uniref:YihY family inner membrane protein n=1 Tax=Trinickia terrae TaxID=2571161 RepID=A0A4U1I3L4_9BURK|nr:YhjD/YihY/BrkB family envelope integrity protein [Trinickia terrae]TKC87827.1 YihY family inner membrane protein [Trinickia terrae]